MTTIARWQDWLSFGLGLWLAVSPWVAGFAQHEAPTANAAFLGLAIALSAHFECTFDECTGEWLQLVAGVWLVAAPFVLGYSHLPVAAANSIAVGALVAVLAASAMSLDKEIGRLWQEWHKKAAR